MHATAISALAGAAGATALTLAHEAGRQAIDDAPRMDVLGERALQVIRERTGHGETDPAALYRQTLAGDLVANSLFYAMVGAGAPHRVWTRGLMLGLAAGIGALVLPGPLGLGDPPSVGSPRNRALTVAYYVLGGLVAAATAHALRPQPKAGWADTTGHAVAHSG